MLVRRRDPGTTAKLLVVSRANIPSASARWAGSICPARSLIESAEGNSGRYPIAYYEGGGRMRTPTGNYRDRTGTFVVHRAANCTNTPTVRSARCSSACATGTRSPAAAKNGRATPTGSRAPKTSPISAVTRASDRAGAVIPPRGPAIDLVSLVLEPANDPGRLIVRDRLALRATCASVVGTASSFDASPSSRGSTQAG